MIESTTPSKPLKERVKEFTYHNWQMILIIALCVGMIFQWQFTQSAKEEVQKLQNAMDVQKKIDAIDVKLDDMTKREKELYPILTQKIADLEQARQQFKAAEAKLKAPNQGAIRNEINKLNEAEVNKLFHDLGFDTSVSECR